jgi:tetratricopeptide (TPR) repeat protein
VWSIAELKRKSARAQRAAAVLGFAIIGGFACLTYTDLARWKDSESLFESATRNAPHKTAFSNLAHFLIKRGEYQRAIENLNRAIALDPDDGGTYGTRALAYAWLNDYEQAKRDYDMAVKLGDRPIQPARAKNVLLGVPKIVPSSDDPEEAWHLFAGVFGLQPRTAESFRGRADIRVKVGDVSGAIGDYAKAIALEPDSPVNYTSRGNAYVRLKDWTNALPDMTRAIELSPTNAASFQNRAVVYYWLGKYDKAWANITQCLKLGGKPHGSFIEALSAAEAEKKIP